MIPKFTLRALILGVAAVAAGMAVLVHPTPRVATIVINGVLVATFGAACLAAGANQPARSFLLGFTIACSGFLVLDGLSRRGYVPREVVTRTLIAIVEDALPPIANRGQPGTTRYFRSDDQFPVYYYRYGDDGTRSEHGQMTVEQAQREGALHGGVRLDDLPHIDDRPTKYMRSQMLPYVLAAAAGLAGGLLSYTARRRTAQGVETP